MTDTIVKSKMRSGFCAVGQHEGQRPKSPSGKPLKTCEYWLTCPCHCHQELTEMCEMAGIERVLAVNPEYEPSVSPFWMPSPEFLAELRAERDGDTTATPANGEWTVGDTTRSFQRAFAPTPSGYRARGQLETEVMKVCDDWDRGDGPVTLPLSFIATQIDEHEPPSVGAIREVLLRWVKYGFAFLKEDPLAFGGFTAIGREKGIDFMKYKWDQERRVNRAKADRGYR